MESSADQAQGRSRPSGPASRWAARPYVRARPPIGSATRRTGRQRGHNIARDRLRQATAQAAWASRTAALLPAGRQPLQRVLADRLQHAEAGRAVEADLTRLIRLVVERAPIRSRTEEAVSPSGPRDRRPNTPDRLRGLQGEAADEDGQAAEERLLGRGEQVVAPGDGVARIVRRRCRQIARAAASATAGAGRAGPAAPLGGGARSGPRPARSPAAARPGGGRSRPRPPRSRRSGRTPGATAWARATKSCTAARPRRRRRRRARSRAGRAGSASGGTGKPCSPGERSGARLVTRTVRRGQAARSVGHEGRRRRARARSCPAPAAGRWSRRCSMSSALGSGRGRSSRTPSARGQRRQDQLRVAEGGQGDEDHPVGEVRRPQPRRQRPGPAASCPPRRDRSGSGDGRARPRAGPRRWRPRPRGRSGASGGGGEWLRAEKRRPPAAHAAPDGTQGGRCGAERTSQVAWRWRRTSDGCGTADRRTLAISIPPGLPDPVVCAPDPRRRLASVVRAEPGRPHRTAAPRSFTDTQPVFANGRDVALA